MFFGEINLPDGLHDALRSNKLVVFAGAGVSVAPPSGLPSFDGLAGRLGAGSGLTREGKRELSPGCFEFSEPADRYLGRLQRKGVKVHERAVELLVGSHTSPHTLHRALLQLFSSSEEIRLVTTNFDTHFTTAATELNAGVVRECYAPALPLGDDFNGIVYLHGCAAQIPPRLVLTDEDFGRAYLTEGWVRRFLVAMFMRYTVVFVGYSHNDPVMTYLARGLPPEHRGRRFAFVAADEEEPWHHLDIFPLAYPLRKDSSNPHEALVGSIVKWAAFAKETLLDKARRIREIAAKGPPLDIETDGQMQLAIKDPATLQPFVEGARSPEWIRWLEEKGVFKDLFGVRAPMSDQLIMVTNWLVRHFLSEYSQAFLGLIQRNHPDPMHPRICDAIVGQLLYSKDALPRNVFSLWCIVLLHQPDGALKQELWAQLLCKCRVPQDNAIVGQLFQRASKPALVLRRHWSFRDESDNSEKEVDFVVQLDLHAVYYLKEWWIQNSGNLDHMAVALEPIITMHLCSIRGTFVAVGQTWGESDAVCFGLVSIEQLRTNVRSDGVEFLIEAAREILQCVQTKAASRAYSIILNWIDSGIPILRRLAVHGMARQPAFSAEQRISFVTERKLLFDVVCQSEVFLLLRLNYAHASAEFRVGLLDIIAEGPPSTEGFDTDEDRHYESFVRLALLRSVDDSCEQTKARFQELQERYPKFRTPQQMEEHAFASQEEANVANIDEILEQPPEKFLDSLLALPAGNGIRGREEYACNLWTLVAKNRVWGLEFQKAARLRGLGDDSVWHQLGNAWREAKPTMEEWAPVLQEFAHPDTPLAFLVSVIDVLKAWVKRENDGIPSDFLDQVATIAYRGWYELNKLPPTNEGSNDWLQEAINRPGGYYAELLLVIVNQQRPSDRSMWRGIPESVRGKLVEVVLGSSPTAEYGRVILAAHLRWLYGLDRTFGEESLLPLFDWSVSARCAEQCWHGFLLWGNWALDYNERLLPFFNEAVRRISLADGEREDKFQGQLANHVTRIAWYVLDNPLADNWLPDRLRELHLQGRVGFAHDIEQVLESSDSNIVAHKWKSWLETYWRLRLQGIPELLTSGEADHMVGWAINMPSNFSNAVELVKGLRNVATFQHIMLLGRVVEKGLVEVNPLAAADLVLMYLETKPPYLRADEELKDVWRRLIHSSLPDGLVKRLRDALVAARIDPDALEQ